MIVLDADSIMSGTSLVRLVELMEQNRSVGIIQTAPQLVLGASLFRRIQQFAARLYGPIFMAGAHFWHSGSGNYWGHNAIIRLKPFMEHCALPELPMLGPIGGRILSHDTIEAALMRRAGYGVWVAYDLEGSYEEGPPELVASLQRDRRWCQGNIQHLLVLFRRGLRASSRVHILLGIMAYASAPLWLLSIVLTTLAAFQTNDAGSTNGVGPSRTAPIAQPALLFAYVMLLLLLPKFLGALQWAKTKSGLQAFGGASKVLLSMLVEIVFSMLLAPILMLFYTKFVLSSLTGVTVKWGQQNRGQDRPGWRQLISLLGAYTIGALLAAALLAWLVPPLLPWLAPVLVGLILAIPFARLTSSNTLGEKARARGLFLIPEETNPPPELRHLDERLLNGESPFFAQPAYAEHYGLLQAVLDPYIHSVHVSLLRLRDQVSEKTREYSEELRTKLLTRGPTSLTVEERNNLLWDADALIALHRELWVSPGHRLDTWWQGALRHYNEATAMATRRSVDTLSGAELAAN
jgi:membrane glycosyltransferase